MPALGGEPWRGMAQVKIADTAAPTQFKAITVSVVDVDPLVNGASQAIWDNDANGNTAWTLRVELGTSTVPPVNVDSPTEIRVRVYDMAGGGSGLQIGSEWVISGLDPAALSSVNTRDNFCFDLDPLDGVLGAELKFGALAIEIQCIRTGGVPASRDYNVNSRVGGTPPGDSTVSWGRGYFRQRIQMIVTTKCSNVSFGGATPSTWAFPDSIFYRHVFNRTRYGGTATGAFTTRFRAPPFGGLGTIIRSQLINFSDTLTNLDHEFAKPSGINEDFTVGAQGSVVESEVELGTDTFGNDTQFALRSTSVPTGWTFATERIYRRLGMGGTTMDPRLTMDSATRTSGLNIVNFGLHTVAATFKLKNARNEFLTSAMAAAVRDFLVKSHDVVGLQDQGTLAATLSPDGSGVYTMPAVAYSGPTSVLSRGAGPNGDTAAHDTLGRDKGLRAVHLTVNQRSSVSARLWGLSDLLRLDAHPQKAAVLVKDTDPFALPGDGESSEYTLGETMYVFGFVADVNGTGLAAVAVKVSAFKPSGALFTEATNNSASGADLGWIVTPITITDIRPMGEGRVRALVDVDHAGALGNYGFRDTALDAVDVIGSLSQPVTIIPAYVFDPTGLFK